MTETPMTWFLSLSPWQQILTCILAILVLPLTLAIALWYFREETVPYDMKKAHKEKEEVDEKLEENLDVIKRTEEETKNLKVAKEEIFKKVDKTNEEANSILNDIDRADSLDELERIRQRIETIK